MLWRRQVLPVACHFNAGCRIAPEEATTDEPAAVPGRGSVRHHREHHLEICVGAIADTAASGAADTDARELRQSPPVSRHSGPASRGGQDGDHGYAWRQP